MRIARVFKYKTVGDFEIYLDKLDDGRFAVIWHSDGDFADKNRNLICPVEDGTGSSVSVDPIEFEKTGAQLFDNYHYALILFWDKVNEKRTSL